MKKIYAIVRSNRFKRDYRRLERQGFDMSELDTAIGQLALNGCLPPRYSDHPLKGEWAGSRECHIGGPKSDWILIYDKDDSAFILQLLRSGSHSKLKIGEK